MYEDKNELHSDAFARLLIVRSRWAQQTSHKTVIFFCLVPSRDAASQGSIMTCNWSGFKCQWTFTVCNWPRRRPLECSSRTIAWKKRSIYVFRDWITTSSHVSSLCQWMDCRVAPVFCVICYESKVVGMAAVYEFVIHLRNYAPYMYVKWDWLCVFFG